MHVNISSIIGRAGALLKKMERIVNRKNNAPGVDLLIPGDDYLKLRSRYYSYKNLLLKNNELLKTLSDIDEEIESKTITLPSLKSYMARIFDTSFSFIQSLNDMSGSRYAYLYDVLARIKMETEEQMKEEPAETPGMFVIPIEKITVEHLKSTGGKAANLGELRNILKMPVPRGFSITVKSYKEFMFFNNLNRAIEGLLVPLNINDPDGIDGASKRIQEMIMNSRVPPRIKEDIEREAEKIGGDTRFSVRSSAVGEDGRISFAGQFKSILNVERASLIDAYKQVTASKYGRRALFYRMAKGIKDKDMPMAVLVLEMINARSSGVFYTLNPSRPGEDQAIVSSVWGQGQYAVSGTISPDVYILDRKSGGTIIDSTVSDKEVQLTLDPAGGTKEVPVQRDNRRVPSASDREIAALYDISCLIEKHFETPQDIEWAIDESGRIWLIQTRPLHVKRVLSTAGEGATYDNRVTVAEGEPASSGLASGPVYIIDRFEQLSHFPEGAVLVARGSSNEYAVLMKSASALVIETGSKTSHLATVAREFNKPMIINVKNVREVLRSGEIVTVDAYKGRIYKGRTSGRAYVRPQAEPSEEYILIEGIVKNVMKHITRLNLTTINEADISPDDFRTVHDIIRFVHEISVKEMFRIGELTEGEGSTQQLVSELVPMYFYIIDLDGGVADEAKFLRKINPRHIRSIPFNALWQGMTHKGVRWSGPVDIDMGGLASVMARSFVRTGVTEKGGKVYVIITDQYVNLSVKLAYHFSIIDAFCGESYINNYINFRFQGGGAGADGRNRRALFIKEVMEAFGFMVEVKGDLVIADLKGASRAETEDKLNMLGRLIGCSRQLDMAISSMDAKDWYVKAFLEGNYSFAHEE
jgi:pyruvate,water dikinase